MTAGIVWIIAVCVLPILALYLREPALPCPRDNDQNGSR